MKPGRRTPFLAFLAVLTGLAALASPASATQYDAPSVSLEKVDRSSITLSLTAGPSGAPAGIKVEWMTRVDFDAMGGWPADNYDATVVHCDFTGTPTLTTTEGVADYKLGPGVSVLVEVGDLFDETGMLTDFLVELDASSEYVFRAKALGDGQAFGSDYSGDLFVTTDPPGEGCVHTQGFWKNHPEAWPVNELILGNVLYDQQQLLDILNTPAAGNGLIFLAHQLIAAKLSLANGGVLGIQPAVDAADALIGDKVVPPVGGDSLEPSEASELTEELDGYNNGALGDCATVPAEESSWGRVKGLYR